MGIPVVAQILLWLIHVGEGMNTCVGRRCRARKCAAMWFAPVPETVWMEAILLSSAVVISEPKVRDWASLTSAGEPAMSRYSWC